MILLDTHCLLWYLQGDARLGRGARETLDAGWHESAKVHAIAAITVWEIAMLVSKGRVRIGQPLAAWFAELFDLTSVRLLPLDGPVAAESVALPGLLHGDPSDRLIVATARHYGLILLTADRSILAYSASGHVGAMDARV